MPDQPIVEQYDQIRARLKALSGGPDAPTPPPVRHSPGFEHWVRETSNGELNLEIGRLKRAGIL